MLSLPAFLTSRPRDGGGAFGICTNKARRDERAQARRDERPDKRHGMLANQESMQPSKHKQEEMSAQTKDMAN